MSTPEEIEKWLNCHDCPTGKACSIGRKCLETFKPSLTQIDEGSVKMKQEPYEAFPKQPKDTE